MNDIDQSITTTIDPRGIGTITLNRPHTHNAFDDKMIAALIMAISLMEANSNVKLIVLNSEGNSFCAGADLQWMRQLANASLEENLRDAKTAAELMYLLYHCKKPTLAMIQGPAYGGGIGLVACCQIAIASTDAVFCFSEVKLGLVPAVISPYVIRAIGARKTRLHFLTATPFDAAKALELGLCHEVVSPEALKPRTEQLITTLLQNGPQSLCAVNQLMNAIVPLDKSLSELTAQTIAKLRASPEGKEGISAFLEKRKPQWIR